MKQTTLIGFSGGGARIAQMAGAYEAIKSKPKIGHNINMNTVFTGVSSGALLAFAYACQCGNKAIEKINKLNSGDVFSTPIIKENGKFNIRCLGNIILNRPYLSKMDSLFSTIRDVVSYPDFEYSKMGYGNQCLVYTVDLSTGALVEKDLFSMEYEQALEAVVQSCSIPAFVASPDGNEFDGGIRMHNPTGHILRKMADTGSHHITKVISIWSRPQNLSSMTEREHSKSIFQRILRTIEIMNFEISKDDERNEDLMCDLMKIPQLKIFTNSNIIQNVYDFNTNRLREAFEFTKNGFGGFSIVPNTHFEDSIQ